MYDYFGHYYEDARYLVQDIVERPICPPTVRDLALCVMELARKLEALADAVEKLKK